MSAFGLLAARPRRDRLWLRAASPRSVGPLLGMIALLGLAPVIGCASAPPKKTPEPTFKSKHKAVNPLLDRAGKDDGMKVSGLMGTLDPGQVQLAMNQTFPAATQCYHRVARRQPYVGGKMNMKFRVRRDGTVKQIRLLSSDVGSRGIESCVLTKLGETRFAKPRGGGEAEFTYPITFPTRLASVSWDPQKIRKGLKKWRSKRRNRKASRKLNKLSFPRGLVMTLYIGSGGHVVSAGMTADEEIGEEFVEELMTTLKRVAFEQPASRYAKVTYRW
jgi:hypothetical protein